jgi:ornithine cyclodeaminase
MSLLILTAADVRKLLPMTDCVEVMERAMRAVSAGAVEMPARLATPLGNDGSYFFLMPGSLVDEPLYGAKVVSLVPDNPAAGRPAVQGFVTLFDRETGAPAALVDGFEITRIRTAAASALATRELALNDAVSHGILGAGVLAAAHLEAVACVRDINKVLIWARDSAKAQRFVQDQGGRSGLDIVAVENPAEAAACDIVTTVTNSATPVLLGEWLRPGCHVNLVGAHRPDHREIDSAGMSCSELYVDWRDGALNEAGDLLIPVSEGVVKFDHVVGEIGEVLSGQAVGRTSDSQITTYKSLGVVAQDLYAAGKVFEEALSSGMGQAVKFP